MRRGGKVRMPKTKRASPGWRPGSLASQRPAEGWRARALPSVDGSKFLGFTWRKIPIASSLEARAVIRMALHRGPSSAVLVKGQGTSAPGCSRRGPRPATLAGETPSLERVLVDVGALRAEGAGWSGRGAGQEVINGYLSIYSLVMVCMRRMQTLSLHNVVVILRHLEVLREEIFRSWR